MAWLAISNNVASQKEVAMKLKFNREVRKSIADELKKVSTFGGIGLGVLGYSLNAPVLLLGAFFWWIACQIIATLLLAMEDES